MESIDQVHQKLAQHDYIADRSLTTSIFLALKLRKPLFLEGEAGVGKTEIAKVLSAMLGRALIRLQCYEGLDVNTAVYEWNYTRQMLEIRMMEAAGGINREMATKQIFSPEFLLKRPLLQAIERIDGIEPVLLVDELDRADEEFEAFLLEILSDFQVTVPEIGTLKAEQAPVVIITSNRTREIHDALKRRCLYHWIDYPSFEKEYNIVLAKIPQVPEKLAKEVVTFVQELRKADLYKLPGVAETLDWISALVALNREDLSEEIVNDTLGVLLKYQDDIQQMQGELVQKIIGRLNTESE
ncbi:MAG: MoxR family ATPase [SAR324 cluster bacterium]|nr:MoxR family ATPase [SAR324 cluster bacterium]